MCEPNPDSSKELVSVNGTDGALTIDLEDWRSALYPSSRKETRQTPNVDDSYIRASVRELLRVLDETKTRATFFVLGEVARATPDIVIEVARKGHEIASHSPTHHLHYRIPRNELVTTIEEDLEFLQELTGKRPLGFRLPYFAMRRSDGWLLDALADMGLKYDSSVVPTWTPLYGIPSAPKSVYYPRRSDTGRAESRGRILEVPVTVWPSWNVAPGLPFGGGFFLKFWPMKMTVYGLRRNCDANIPLVLYIHPGDIESCKEDISGMSVRDRTIQHLGAKRGATNLRALLREFRLTTISEAFQKDLASMTE